MSIMEQKMDDLIEGGLHKQREEREKRLSNPLLEAQALIKQQLAENAAPNHSGRKALVLHNPNMGPPILKTIELLRDLYHLQNGPPLETYRKDWEETMQEIDELLGDKPEG